MAVTSECVRRSPGRIRTVVGVVATITVLSAATLARAQAGAVSGTVTDHTGSLPIEGVNVHIYDAAGTYVTTATSDASGAYATTAVLADGAYFARTSNSTGYLDQIFDSLACQASCDVTTGTPIVVSGGATVTGVDFALVLGGLISGTVTDASSGDPIPNVEVIIYDSTGFLILFRIATDGSGSYETAQTLAAGTYYARTWNELGYLNEQYDDLPCVPSCSPTGGTPITVGSGATAGIDFALVRGGSVSGTVINVDTTDPIQNMDVDIRSDSGAWMGMGTTDADGDYMTSGVPAGTYFVVIPNRTNYLEELYNDLPCHFGCSATSGTPITVAAGTDTPGIDFQLENGGTISGAVTRTSDGQGIADAWVRIHDASGASVTQQLTATDGSYTTTGGIPSGTYYAMTVNWDGYIDALFDGQPCVGSLCTATAGTPISVTTGADTPGVDFALDPGATFSGTVTDGATGLGLWSRQVKIYDAGGSFVSEGFADTAGVYRTRAGVPTGTYYARSSDYTTYVDEVFDDVPCYGECDVTVGTPLSAVAGSDLAGVDFALDQQAWIEGRVTDAVSGDPISNLFMAIYDAAGSFVTYDYTDANGDYRSVLGLAPGSYFVQTNYTHLDYLGELFDDLPCSFGCDPVTGTPVAVTAGTGANGIDFGLARGGLIIGRVTDAATGAPLAGVGVKIYDVAGAYRTETVTDAGGDYVSPVYLPAGSYVAHTINGLGYVDELYDGVMCGATCDPAAGTPIGVAAGDTTPGIDFALDQQSWIAGRVTDAVSGDPISNLFMAIYDAAGSFVTYDYTDANGDYRSVLGLAPGSYFVQTNYTHLDYLGELFDDIPCSFGCDPVTGTPVAVTAGTGANGIDFRLARGGLISGRVTDANTGLPLAGVGVKIYDLTGTYRTEDVTDAGGDYIAPVYLPAGSYVAYTINGLGYVDELYDGVMCGATCDPAAGAPIGVAAGGTTSGIDFALAPGSSVVFRDGFEGGTTGVWSAAVP